MISHHFLYTSNLKETITFYRDILGMNFEQKEHETETHYCFWYNKKEAELVFIYQPDFARKTLENQGYWKIALSVEDVIIARETLLKKGILVGTAFQVPDVAFLCHFKDNNGYEIELIQHKFEQNHIPIQPKKEYALGSKTRFLLITYRVKNIEKSLNFYQNLGMRLLSKQEVTSRNFTIYFLAFSSEELPNKNTEALENREWLWQRNYTVLELQHIWGTEKSVDFKFNTSTESGFYGMGILNSEQKTTIQDPDGYNIILL